MWRFSLYVNKHLRYELVYQGWSMLCFTCHVLSSDFWFWVGNRTGGLIDILENKAHFTGSFTLKGSFWYFMMSCSLWFIQACIYLLFLVSFPRLKYSISVVADKGLKKALFTSSRLKKGEVLYLETHSKR